MIYVGEHLYTAGGAQQENCLINPKLKVAATGADTTGSRMPYWPSYADIPPTSRRAYLEWLAGGRKDPHVGIGYVFLFFYGLERRFLVDRAAHEATVISSEIRRLLTIYGENYSFRNYASMLLDIVSAMALQTNERPSLDPDLRKDYEIPFPVRLYIGHLLAEGKPPEADDALLWVISCPDIYLRTPAKRCFDELVALWRIRFVLKYPKGMSVPPPRKRLKISYKAASGTFDAAVDLSISGAELPDISGLAAPVRKLTDLLETCTDALDPYSRILGRRPEAKGTIEALMALPQELLVSDSGSVMASLRDRVETLFGGRPLAPAMASSVLDILGLPLPSDGKMSATVRTQIGAILDKLDIAFEPDRRYGSAPLAADGRMVLFKAKCGGAVDSDKPEYKSAKATIDVTVLAALADGTVASAEYEALTASLRSLSGISDIERARLLAYAAVMMQDGLRQQAVLNKISTLPEMDRQQIAQAAIGVVLADGHASPAEIKFLEKLYKALGLTQEDLYAALHRGATIIESPVTVAPEETAKGTPIPARPAPPSKKTGIQIDHERLQRIKHETSTVSALLADIFVEEEVSPPAKAATTTQAVAFQGLDAAHGALLSAILTTGSLDRAAFEERARSLRLLPDGAIETINEWSFETFDEAALEDGETIMIAEHLREELDKLEIAA
ncbi:TerB N-terminal domain-containing protein [Microvirga sp. M2]|uniref:tellurite resistance TerB family protein n=1 Tax=Microvirga sp. M2 TaxID=3073270 RepID=UPI0039C2636C